MKKYLAIALSLLAAASASAEVLTPEQALARVSQAKQPTTVRRAAANLNATPALTLNAAGQPAIYVMGSLVVSAESQTPALLGYADADIDPNNLPDGLQYMLDCYSREIASLRRTDGANSGDGDTPSTNTVPDRAAIAPLCKTLWNQDAPYNYQCPVLNGERTVTGCVATAMAQVMYALPEHPTGGTGSITYAWTAGDKNLTLDFSKITFDWDNMLTSYDTYTNAQRTAVATLMKAVGYAAKMEYNVNASGGSGTQSTYMAQGLVDYLGYDKATTRYLERSWFTMPDWKQLIYDELAAGRPVYYSGVTPDWSAGHAFVVDGYSTDDYYHLNWGWGGLSNGYYLLTALDPTQQGIGGSSSGYDYDQSIIVGMRTARADSELTTTIYAGAPLVPASDTAKPGATVTFDVGIWSASLGTLPYERMLLRFTNATTGAVTYATTSVEASDWAFQTGFESFTVTMPTTLTAGATYKVDAVVRNSATGGTDTEVIVPAGHGDLYAAVSATKEITFIYNLAAMEFDDLKVTTPLYVGHSFGIEATLANPTGDYLCGTAYYGIGTIDSEGYMSVDAYGRTFFEVDADSEVAFSMTGSIPSTLAAGDYYLYMLDDQFNIVSDLVNITVEADPGTATLSALSLKVTNAHRDNLSFTAQIECSAGYYDNNFVIGLFEGSTNVAMLYGKDCRFQAGKKYQITISGTYANGTVGQQLIAAIYRTDSGFTQLSDNSYVYFNLEDDDPDLTSAISEVELSVPAASEQLFDLQGRRISSVPASGLYIQGGTLRTAR